MEAASILVQKKASVSLEKGFHQGEGDLNEDGVAGDGSDRCSDTEKSSRELSVFVLEAEAVL